MCRTDDLHARALALGGRAGRWRTGRRRRLAKQAIDDGLSRSLADGLAIEQATFVEVFHTDDSRIGVASFLEHGPGKAAFTGR